jgi:hypothetical protein
MTLKLPYAVRRLRASRLIAFAAAFPIAETSSLHAQDRNALSIEASVGGGSALGGGPYVQRTGLATELSVAFRLNSTHDRGLIVSLARESQETSNPDLICAVEPSGQCAPTFPTFSSVLLLAGLETGRPHGATVRVLVGPGYFHSNVTRVGGGEGRFEVATPTAAHFALLGFARADVLGRVSGSTLMLWAVGVGIRLE